jgi:hypothetical protein
MTSESIARFVSELREAHPGITFAQDANRTLLKIANVVLPTGCTPEATDALVVLDPTQPKPRLLVKNKPRTPAGVEPRNVNPECVAGESWFGFSFNIAWDDTRHTAEQFLQGAIRRFAKNE